MGTMPCPTNEDVTREELSLISGPIGLAEDRWR